MQPHHPRLLPALRILSPCCLLLSVLCSLYAILPGMTVFSFLGHKVLTAAQRQSFRQASLSWLVCAVLACVLYLAALAIRIFQAQLDEKKESRGYEWEVISVVIVIFGFVAPFFLSDFLESPVRSPVSRTKTDMRTIATGLEAYLIDNNAYPLTLGLLTTPVEYLTSVPQDVFSPTPSGQYHYYHDADGWLLWSCGPDGVYDLTRKNIPTYYDSKTTQPAAPLFLISYDATNGSQSAGDVWRVKQ